MDSIFQGSSRLNAEQRSELHTWLSRIAEAGGLSRRISSDSVARDFSDGGENGCRSSTHLCTCTNALVHAHARSSLLYLTSALAYFFVRRMPMFAALLGTCMPGDTTTTSQYCSEKLSSTFALHWWTLLFL